VLGGMVKAKAWREEFPRWVAIVCVQLRKCLSNN
jgi:hypothetical protein